MGRGGDGTVAPPEAESISRGPFDSRGRKETRDTWARTGTTKICGPQAPRARHGVVVLLVHYVQSTVPPCAVRYCARLLPKHSDGEQTINRTVTLTLLVLSLVG